MFCTNCGNKLTSKTKFCPSCGVENVSLNAAEIIVDPPHQTLDIFDEPVPQNASEGPVEIATLETVVSDPSEPIPEIETPLDIRPREQMGPSSETYSKMSAFGRIALIWCCAISVVSVVAFVIAAIFMYQDITLLELLVGVILAALIVPAIGWLGTLPLFPWSRSFLLGRLNWKPFLYRILSYVMFVFGSLIFVFNTFTPRADNRIPISMIALILGFIILGGILVSCAAFFISKKSVKEITAKYGGGDHKGHKWGYLKPGVFLCFGLALPMISLLDVDKIGLRQSIISAAEGNKVKQYELAYSFQHGDETFRENNSKYQFYLEKAASNGHGEAMYDIANNYKSGRRGYDKDLSKYMNFMSQSAESDWENVYQAQTYIGEGYYDGTDSFPQDKDRGIYWLKRAVENGGGIAYNRLREINPPNPYERTDADRYLLYFTEKADKLTTFNEIVKSFPYDTAPVIINSSFGAWEESAQRAYERSLTRVFEQYVGINELYVIVDGRSKDVIGCIDDSKDIVAVLNRNRRYDKCPAKYNRD